MVKTIGNPLSFIAGTLRRGSHYVSDGVSELTDHDEAPIEIRALQVSDLKTALRKGYDDFSAMRTDVMFIAIIYPVIGLLLAWFALNRELLPMLFPMVSGFALLGPVFAVGLYEMSRRREAGQETDWSHAFGVASSPSFVPILVLGGYLFATFFVWMAFAFGLYRLTLGPTPPDSAMTFVTDVFTTSSGWVMLAAGTAIGFVFAVAVLAVSVVSFPILLDRHLGLSKAVITSVEVTKKSPVAVALWGAIVVGMLGVGVVTLFVGLIFVLPILGHATWHLYRQAIVQPASTTPA